MKLIFKTSKGQVEQECLVSKKILPTVLEDEFYVIAKWNDDLKEFVENDYSTEFMLNGANYLFLVNISNSECILWKSGFVQMKVKGTIETVL